MLITSAHTLSPRVRTGAWFGSNPENRVDPGAAAHQNTSGVLPERFRSTELVANLPMVDLGRVESLSIWRNASDCRREGRFTGRGDGASTG